MVHRIVFSQSRLEQKMHMVDFDPRTRSGSVIVNLSVFPENRLADVISTFGEVMDAGLAVAPYVKLVRAGEILEDETIPAEHVGLCTVCSITVDGVLCRAGIPTRPILGGTMQVEDNHPLRFTDIITYRSTTLDPLEMLMSQELTSVLQVTKSGSGVILANLREIPMSAYDETSDILQRLQLSGLYGIMEVGEPNTDMLGVQVSRNHFMVAIVGGTNPMAALQEKGIPVKIRAITGCIDFREFSKIDKL
jgi:repressor of nif and glnA expression